MNKNSLQRVILSTCFMLFSSMVMIDAAQTDRPFYIIAHMANSKAAVDWAVSEGANAIENDLNFDDNGNPAYFEHPSICDCICAIGSNHICHKAQRQCGGPTASEDAAAHLQHIASLPGIALLFIDSKVNANMGATLSKAGSAVIPFMDKYLFGNGYQGKVIISSATFDTYDYLRAAGIAAKSSSNMGRYFFTFDQENNDYTDVMDILSRFTNNRVYGTGDTSCSPKTFFSGIEQGVAGVKNGENGMTYIWTVDNKLLMESYIDLGVQGIMTNRLSSLKNLVTSRGLKLANPSDTIPTSTKSVTQASKCDCDYRLGGCRISMPPPSGTACKCARTGLFHCDGSIVSCTNPNNQYCLNPDVSRNTCLFGGGNCGGY